MDNIFVVDCFQSSTEVAQNLDCKLFGHGNRIFLAQKRVQLVVKRPETTQFQNVDRSIVSLVLLNCLDDIRMVELAKDICLK